MGLVLHALVGILAMRAIAKYYVIESHAGDPWSSWSNTTWGDLSTEPWGYL